MTEALIFIGIVAFVAWGHHLAFLVLGTRTCKAVIHAPRISSAPMACTCQIYTGTVTDQQKFLLAQDYMRRDGK